MSMAVAWQSFVRITQNFLSLTVGIGLVAGGKKDRHWKPDLSHIVKFPPAYAMAAGVVTVLIRSAMGVGAVTDVAERIAPLWPVLIWVKSAFVAVALVTLRAQLGMVREKSEAGPVKLSVFLWLLIRPAIALGLICLLGVRGIEARILLISSSPPTAINVMLLCLEFENHPDFASRVVLYSTLPSPLTVTMAIFLAQSGLLPGFWIRRANVYPRPWSISRAKTFTSTAGRRTRGERGTAEGHTGHVAAAGH